MSRHSDVLLNILNRRGIKPLVLFFPSDSSFAKKRQDLLSLSKSSCDARLTCFV